MSEIKTAVMQAALNTGTGGTQDFTVAGLGWTPKAALFFLVPATVAGTVAVDARMSIGAATGASNEWCVTAHSEDNWSTTVSDRDSVDTRCVYAIDNTGTESVAATFNSWISNGVRLNNVTNTPATAQLLTIVFFGGEDLQAHANTKTLSTQDTAVDITDPGFQPNLVIIGSMGDDIAASAQARYMMAFGAAHDTGSGIDERFAKMHEERNVSVGSPDAYLDTTESSGQITQTAVSYTVEISNFDANGFSATARGGNSGSDDLCYLALDTGDREVKVGSIDPPTGTGEDAKTGVGFKPQLVMMGMTMLTAEDTLTLSTANAGAFGVSMFTPDDEACVANAVEDGAGTTDTQCVADVVAVDLDGDDGAAAFDATFVEMGTDGWTLDYTAADGTQRKWWYLAIEEEAVAGGMLNRFGSMQGGISGGRYSTPMTGGMRG